MVVGPAGPVSPHGGQLSPVLPTRERVLPRTPIDQASGKSEESGLNKNENKS